MLDPETGMQRVYFHSEGREWPDWTSQCPELRGAGRLSFKSRVKSVMVSKDIEGDSVEVGENIPLTLTWTPRPHRTRQTEDHNDEPGTDCFTFDRTQRKRRNTDVGGKKLAVISMSSLMLAVCKLGKWNNRGERFALMGRFSSGSQLKAHEKHGGQDRDQREGSSVRVFRRQPSCQWGPRKHSLLPFLHIEHQKGGII